MEIINDITVFIKECPTSIDRFLLWKYVNLKIKRSVTTNHVTSVISILFDEMVKDLMANKKIKIFNFGEIYLKKLNDRYHYDYTKNQILPCKGWRILKINLTEKTKRYMIDNLNIDETFSLNAKK